MAIYVSLLYALMPLRTRHTYSYGQHKQVFVGVSRCRERGCIILICVFLFGAMMFHEKNLKSKLIDLALVLLSMLFLFIGSY